ncbi:unnamed protein product [Rotaria sp. Silwood2]|nr:unnamed protein product [Rotaria sp. Silwood2]
MNSDTSNLYSSPPYNYSTIQPTNSFTNPFTSNQSPELTVGENGNETKVVLTENNNNSFLNFISYFKN